MTNLKKAVENLRDTVKDYDHAKVEETDTVEITIKEYELFQKLLKIWKHSSPEKTGAYFICGEAGDHDINRLPDVILVCPTYGINVTAIYEKKHVGKSGQ